MARRLSLSKILLFAAVSGLMLFGISQRACADGHKRAKRHATTSGQLPAQYYQSADGLKGKALKMALGQIARDHTVFNYGELWYHYQVTDVVPGTESQVFDYYSPEVHYFPGGGNAASGMNKEHACPQSWWGSGAICDAYSDLFNVMPSEVNANSAKSNYPLGVVGSASYKNTCMKVGSSARSAYQGSVFEPCDEYKGDFARLYFYVATCYADAPWGSRESVAKTVAFTREDYPTIKPWLLDLLLEWNAQDPVSDWEILRNERVYSEQGNRNPYIDYPQLADYVWGDSTQYAFDLSHAIINGNGSGHGSGIVPGEGGNTDDPVTPGPGGDADDDDDEVPVAGLLLNETFASVTEGNDTDNTGSGTPWSGNENFVDVTTVFQAGGAVKLGSSSKSGTMVSRTLKNAVGAKLLVTVRVKGWSKVEGSLVASLTGSDEQQASYSATMSDSYETVTYVFEGCKANAQLTLRTSAKRAFITSVRVEVDSPEASIQQVHSDASSVLARNNARSYTLTGQPASARTSGWVISQGRLFIQ